MLYNWQQPDWPDFTYQLEKTVDWHYEFAQQSGHLSGMLKAMPQHLQMEALVAVLVSEAIKTSAIEGEYLSRQDVVSSIRNNLGVTNSQEPVSDKRAKGVGALMVNVRNDFSAMLTAETLLSWHKTLMEYNQTINAGTWRIGPEPMQIISGAIGKEKIHFEAPPSALVPYEMERFIQWFNETSPAGNKAIKNAPVRAAIAHLYFESIHPFEDGNGRIGRAIAEKALFQTIGIPLLISLSQTIETDKKSYYTALQNASCSNEITDWIDYFVEVVFKAQQEAVTIIEFTLKKVKFFDQHKIVMNERQSKAINKMLDAGVDGFEGGMTAKKYSSITKASKATATRDLQILVEQNILVISGSGRSTHYYLNL